MTRLTPLILAVVAFTSAPAAAATYSAKLAVTPEAGLIIARDISWTCGPDACQGSTAESRPAVLCQGLARRAGRLTGFIANGRAFGTAELDKCNASAKRGVAAQRSLATAN